MALSAGDRPLRASAVHPVSTALWRLLERGTHPGIVSHYWLRKRWIEMQCMSSIAHRVERVIVIGAGLDALALRLAPLHPKVQVDWHSGFAQRRGSSEARKPW